jgi:hypothetical protein
MCPPNLYGVCEREKGVHEFRNFAEEERALIVLKRGLGVLGMKEPNLEGRWNGAVEKQVLAWWLRKKTVGSRRWISQILGMGDLSKVSNGIRKVDVGKDS